MNKQTFLFYVILLIFITIHYGFKLNNDLQNIELDKVLFNQSVICRQYLQENNYANCD